jgi:hypothetical protein
VVIFGVVLATGIVGAAWPAAASPWRWLGAGATGLAGLALAVGAGARLGRQLTPDVW